MKAENLYKAMNYIDDEIIYRNGKVERIVDIKQKSKKQVNKKQVFRIMVAVAAAAVLFTGSSYSSCVRPPVLRCHLFRLSINDGR